MVTKQDSGFQLEGNAAVLYEAQKVPSMFAPLADATIDAITISKDDTIIDLACGTGVLARKVRSKLGSHTRIVGADLNESMIQVAKSLNDSGSEPCEWQIADVCDLPYEDGTFSLVMCQQGVQYFPDKVRAMREVRRVLNEEGRISLTVWCENSIFIQSVSERLSENVSKEVGRKALAPFSYNAELLAPILSDIGFVDFSSKKLTVNRIVKASKDAIIDELMSLPVAALIKNKGQKTLEKIVNEVMEDMSCYVSGLNIVTPQETRLIQARVGLN